MHLTRFVLLCSLALGALWMPARARAAECIEVSMSKTILSPGNYCLSANLTGASTPIVIEANNVDFDCRGYTLEGTNPNANTNSYGIQIINRRNVHVRNCHIHGGFAAGIYAYQDNGLENQNHHLTFTNNTISGMKWFGILAYGTDIDIRGNRIHDIGGRDSFAMGIRIGGSGVAGQTRTFVVADNVVTNVVSTVNNGYGIYGNNPRSSVISGNVVSGTDTNVPGTYWGWGIYLVTGGRNQIIGNTVVATANGDFEASVFATASDRCHHNHLDGNYEPSNCDTTPGNF